VTLFEAVSMRLLTEAPAERGAILRRLLVESPLDVRAAGRRVSDLDEQARTIEAELESFARGRLRKLLELGVMILRAEA
jgi:hypothetical protein